MADPTARFVLTAEDRTGRAIASADRNLKMLSRTANSVRSMFGVLGVAVSGRAFANWIGGALKAAEATGEHATQIKAAQTAMADMKKASDELAVSVGVRLVPAMQALSAVFTGWNRIISGADPFQFESQIEDLRDQLKLMDAQFKASQGMPFEWQMKFVENIAAVENRLDDLIKKQRQALGFDMGPQFRQSVEMRNAVGSLKMIGDAYDKFGGLKRPNVDIDWLLPEDELQEIVVEARQMTVDELLKPFPAAEVQKMFEPIREQSGLAAAELGMNFKSAFDGWLIDGERGFRDLLRRMGIAMTTSALFKGLAGLFPGGSFFSNFFGGFRANGGPVSAGKGYIVGERGPELFMPGQSGMIAANAGGPTYHFTTHIDARGADRGLVERLPAILEQNNRRLKAELKFERNRGR